MMQEQLIFSINLMQSNALPRFNPSHIFTLNEYPAPHMAKDVSTWRVMMEKGQESGPCFKGKELEEAIEGKSDLKAKFGSPGLPSDSLNQPHLAEMLFDESNCELYDAVRPI